jgi:hypothetical protein
MFLLSVPLSKLIIRNFAIAYSFPLFQRIEFSCVILAHMWTVPDAHTLREIFVPKTSASNLI